MANAANMIADGAKFAASKCAVIALKDAGFRPLDQYRTRWTDGQTNFRVVESIQAGANGHNRFPAHLRQIWGGA